MTKALQAITKAVTGDKDAAIADRGKLAAIGRQEERILFMLRGCDAFSVSLGERTLGRDLFHFLRNTGAHARPEMRRIKFPVNLYNRVCFGLASLNVGAKTVAGLPDYCLGARDFPLTSEASFDSYVQTANLNLEKPIKGTMTLNNWFRCAIRQCWALSCVYGEQHLPQWEKAASKLLDLAETDQHQWPPVVIMDLWEELWARYIQELRDLDIRLVRDMNEVNPTFDRIAFFATTPGLDHQPWLRLPGTFDLEDPDEFFQTDVVPRRMRIRERLIWDLTNKDKPKRALGATVGGTAEPDEQDEPARTAGGKDGRKGKAKAKAKAKPKPGQTTEVYLYSGTSKKS
jgi:hypothetical protein